jgi:hypothetical protein
MEKLKPLLINAAVVIVALVVYDQYKAWKAKQPV